MFLRVSKTSFLREIEESRVAAQNSINEQKKKLDEQYFTPSRVSKIMAAMFSKKNSHVRILDPCCGVGNLAAACYSKGVENKESVSIVLVEKDQALYGRARSNFAGVKEARIINADFLHVVEDLDCFDRIILNPPYSKLVSLSSEVACSRKRLGYADTNLYSLFVASCLTKLSQDGELVAIIPRSFCNGPMFRGFREFIFKNYFFHEIYLFESRKIFYDSKVLQETLIIKLSRIRPDAIRISHESDTGLVSRQYISSDLLTFGADSQKFIHIPLAVGDNLLLKKVSKFTNNIKSLGLRASTGKVVDFRCENWLEPEPSCGTVKLLYHDNLLGTNRLDLDLISAKKKRFILLREETEKLLLPRQNVVLVRRMSFKESPTRVIAAALLEENFSDEFVGIENHLNYIFDEAGLFDRDLCLGLCFYLSTPTIDSLVRRFSGHTQINVADLNSLPLPSAILLKEFGKLLQQEDDLDKVAAAEVFFFG